MLALGAGGGNVGGPAVPPGHEANELGLLAGAFREALERLGQTEQELRRFNAELEDRVAARTTELDAANRGLAESNAELATANRELWQKIQELERARQEIQTLEGFLPICMHCKKIRDDQGYWNQLERFITQRSGAKFSHGICPGCLAEHYSELQTG